jgi:hypothetical protein
MIAKKTLDVVVKLNINSMEATNKEPIGPTLGQYGVSAEKFCEAFNKMTSIYKEKILLRSKIYIYSDKTFELKIRVPSINFFIKNSLIYQLKNEDKILNSYDSKRKPGYFNELEEFLPILNKNIIYTISLYLLSLDIYDKILINSLFKKIKSSLLSQGVLYITI